MAEISYEEFSKVELRVGTILLAEKVEGADRLYKLTVDIGNGEKRILAAGIAKFYTQEELVGRQAVVVANIAPRTIRGIASQGMILAADSGEAVVILSPDKKVPEGSIVK